MTLAALWYGRSPLRWLLWPVSLLYGLLVVLRRVAYRQGLLGSERMPVPVIVVGNITVGGTGKTPLVLWLARELRRRGWRPGIVTRGYGGRSRTWPRAVTAQSDPREVGDEPVLLAGESGCPVVAAPRRVAAARELLAANDVGCIVADDGLQHYALQRDVEIAVLDGTRGLGNRMLLPAGPLREPPGRLDSVDLVVTNGGGEFRMDLKPVALERLDGSETRDLQSFAGRPVHAVAGLGNPARFFDSLRAAGMRVTEHAFPDHHDFRPDDLQFARKENDNECVIMTAKDAVKCQGIAGGNAWVLRVEAQPGAALRRQLDLLLDRLKSSGYSAKD